MKPGRDHDWHELMAKASPKHEAPALDAEHPLFILYTSGSTGKPKGVLHTHGRLSARHQPHQQVRVRSARERHVTGAPPTSAGSPATATSCTARSRTRATVVMYEGVPNHPDPGRFWSIIERHGVTIFYTAPTAIRTFVKWGDELARAARPVVAALARHRRRADQPRSVDVVPRDDRRRPLSDRRHVLADRDRRDHDDAAAGRDRRASPARARCRSSASRPRCCAKTAAKPASTKAACS